MKQYYVVDWNFREDKAFTDKDEAFTFFQTKVGSVSYVELKRINLTPLGYYSTSLKIWRR